MRRGQLSFALVVGAMAIAIVASPAQAAVTRADYVAQVDPICQAAASQEDSALQPVLRAVKRSQGHHRPSRKAERRLKRRYTTYLSQKAAIERAANDQIAAVPPAPDDVSLIQVWLRARNELVGLETGLLSVIKDKPSQGIASFIRLIGLEEEVYDLVRDFGFQYCNASPPVVAVVFSDVFR
jgi:hypothetical protein